MYDVVVALALIAAGLTGLAIYALAHLYVAAGRLVDHMTGPEAVRAARRWDQEG